MADKKIKLEPDYDINKFFRPSVALDILVFTVKADKLQILLVQRDVEPFRNYWAIPGGFIKKEETLEEAAKRELYEETGVKTGYLEQLYSFGDPGRDPRTRVISVAYFSLIPADLAAKIRPSTDVKKAKWFPVENLPELAFDHKKIIDYAIRRIHWKLEYTNVVYSLLDEEFTLTDLQKVYEAIFARKFDKRNFRKKILSLHLIEPTGKTVIRGVQRPAKTYCFKEKNLSFVEIT